MAGIIDELSILIKQENMLDQKINILVEEVEEMKEILSAYVNNTPIDEDWMTLSYAAQRCGLTQPALRQRIKNGKYPETIVWKQKEQNGAIFVNLKNLREYL